jgi:dipeptidyl aminopeptidase/acylaminoacyl peptidase
LSIAPAADGNRILTVRFPKFAMDPNAEPPGAAATGPPAEMAQLRDTVKGTRMTIAIETATPLIRTNSPHVEGNRVVLVDIDVEAALFSRQIDMLRAAPASFDEYLWMLGDLPGVKLANDHVITIEFQDSAPAAAPVQQAPASTEIFLATLTRNGNRLTLGSPVNITNSDGYDNQPSFTPDGASILFASGRRSGTTATAVPDGAAPQTDIYRYDIAGRQVVRVTATPESEFSPTVTPDGKRLSVVRVEASGTQRLWSFTPDGNDAALVLSEIKPVGYHAWTDEHTLALFVLGQPATLQVADVATGKAEVVAQDVGRSIQRMPGGRISFVQRGPRVANGAPELTITELSITKDKDQNGLRFQTSALVPPVGGATEPYPVWLPDGTALMAHENTLFSWQPGQAGWVPIADLGSLGLKEVTRLALSPKADRLALVAAGR